eukprot:TRINITY_DN7928_c0_g1_i1.p1 TRINITY_DN7928_c0_g1~~TRINITY_DN7928_c0_g1_i1.p1  ORF type:complete len:338 (-),score=47.42 TRINITY_DN7928_c0_g1_i1:33-1046(-)
MSHRVMRRNALQTRTFSNHNSVAVRASLDAERQPANVLPEPNAVALPAPMALENAAPAENPANVPPEMGIPDLLQVNFQQVFRALGNLGLNIAEVNARQEQLVNADIDPVQNFQLWKKDCRKELLRLFDEGTLNFFDELRHNNGARQALFAAINSALRNRRVDELTEEQKTLLWNKRAFTKWATRTLNVARSNLVRRIQDAILVMMPGLKQKEHLLNGVLGHRPISGDIIRQLVAREREEWELDVRGFASEHGVALSLDATINKIFDEIAVAMSAAGAFTKRRVILWFVIVHLFVRGIKILPNRIARQVADYIELLEEGDLQGACPHLHAYLQGVRE